MENMQVVRMTFQAEENGSAISKIEPLFKDLNVEDCEPDVTEISSLCLQCGKDGLTKILLTKIPFYKDVIVMSFSCSHCHWKNNELQPAATIQEKGVLYKLKVKSVKDLNRQVVKTEWASVMIPDIEFEIPAKSQEGAVTNIEGILHRVSDGLEIKLKELEATGQASTEKLQQFLQKLKKLQCVETPFHFVLRDASGNSFLENVYAPKPDPEIEVFQFERSRDEDLMLGLPPPEEKDDSVKGMDAAKKLEENMANEVMEFPTNCPYCSAPCITNMKLIHIPHFKDVVIMATVCDTCGHKTNEVQSSSGIDPLGVKITLKISGEMDLKRDLVKSNTCSIHIPEVELYVGGNAISGRFTTVEGLIVNIKELMKANPFTIGDSVISETKERMDSFLNELDKIVEGKRSVTLILDDPCGHSYIQSLEDPDLNSQMTVERYERTFDQNEELGLNDMKVDNYEKT